MKALQSLLLAVALVVSPGAAAAEPLAAQTSKDGPVTVKVVPLEIGTAAAEWRFEVVLDTHTVPLDQDMVAAARLEGSGGKASWQGDPPGGHHRKGILVFPRPTVDEAVVTLTGIGGVAERVFRWRVP
jgi:hypothetical protein